MATAFSENAESVNVCQRRYFMYVADTKRCHPCQRCQRKIIDPIFRTFVFLKKIRACFTTGSDQETCKIIELNILERQFFLLRFRLRCGRGGLRSVVHVQIIL